MNRNKRERVGRGAAGNYRLNQHAPRFADRRTRRNRSRDAQRRNAIRDARD